ncbi:FliO/MopB family protein [Acidovorax sp. NPDC077693]|uniref:FliO/MopB family protein n=1 Tax=unclassified Acidovorax TaxID=2684926 RepID=UPI0037C9B18F
MTQTLLVVVLFVGAMACLPWLVKRLQQRHAASSMAAGTASRVLSVVAVGPQQRVVTVEVGPEHARTWLVLGVTAQNVSCLHVLPSAPAAVGQGVPAGGASPVNGTVRTDNSFAQEVAMAVAGTGKPPHG